MNKPELFLDDLKSIQHDWSRAAESLVAQHGIVVGTKEFLKIILNDDNRLVSGVAVVSSFGTEAASLLALVADANPHTPIIMIDTGLLFPETITYRDQLSRQLGLTDLRIAGLTLEEAERIKPPEVCCDEGKRAASARALKDFPAWISGRKRYQGDKRADIPMVEFLGGKIKINPMALWSEDEIHSEITSRNLLKHPLESKGYGSVGCWTCTAPGAGRSGRWPGAAKTECGLHFGDGGGI